MTKICGFDLSINSTGVYFRDTENPSENRYYIVTPHQTPSYKKAEKMCEGSALSFLFYDKQELKGLEYTMREYEKTKNLNSVVHHLNTIVKRHKPDLVQIEGVAYGATSGASIIDLSGLNFMVRMMLENNNVKYNIISPSDNKKQATGNGAAKKDEMIYAWHICDPKMKQLTSSFAKSVGIDDIADAFFLSYCGFSHSQPADNQ